MHSLRQSYLLDFVQKVCNRFLYIFNTYSTWFCIINWRSLRIKNLFNNAAALLISYFRKNSRALKIFTHKLRPDTGMRVSQFSWAEMRLLSKSLSTLHGLCNLTSRLLCLTTKWRSISAYHKCQAVCWVLPSTNRFKMASKKAKQTAWMKGAQMILTETLMSNRFRDKGTQPFQLIRRKRKDIAEVCRRIKLSEFISIHIRRTVKINLQLGSV